LGRASSCPSIGVLSAETEEGSVWSVPSAQTEVSEINELSTPANESLNRVYFPLQIRDGWYDWQHGRMLG